MRVKRFTAETLEEAVEQVKEEFGEDALIIETRRVGGGVFNFWRRQAYEVVAALDKPAVAPRKRPTREPVAREPVANGAPDPWFRLHARLISQGMPETSAQGIVRTVRERVEKGEGPKEWDRVLQAAGRYMAEGLTCVGAEEALNEGGVVPLIGPTGVGKTSTLAKLAANFSLLGERRVAIVTTDTQRLGAVEQLRTYTDLVQIPLAVADGPDRLREHVQAHGDKDLILVDTAGCNPYASDELSELQTFLEALDSPRTHLVVSATTKMEDLLDIARRFDRVGYDRVIVSKVDETRTYGALYTLGVTLSKPLAYITTGQAVPEDIEVADAERIIRLMLEDTDP